MLKRRVTFTCLVVSMCLTAAPPHAGALNASAATCAVNVRLIFTPALTTTLINRNIDYQVTSTACVGTALLAPMWFAGDMFGLSSCEAIAASGIGPFDYPDAGDSISVVYAGTGAGGDMLLAPAGAALVGSATFAGVLPAQACTAAGVTTMNYVGSVTFVDPVI